MIMKGMKGLVRKSLSLPLFPLDFAPLRLKIPGDDGTGF